jgi:integrator complex subunit 1
MVLEQWEQVAMECEPVDLVASILAAIDQQDSDTVVGLVCGAIKFVTSSRVKSDSILTLSLLYLARIRPHIFCNETIRSALESILKRDSAHSFKGRNNPTVHILAANLLARGYHDKKQWPESFLRIYIDDAVNERVWVDNEDCSSFVDNILTGFGTKVPPKWMLQPELNTLNPAARELDENDSDASSDVFKSSDSTSSDGGLPQRFAHTCQLKLRK